MFKIVKFLCFFATIFFYINCDDEQICIESLSSKFKAEIITSDSNTPFTIDSIQVTEITTTNEKEILNGTKLNSFEALLPQEVNTITYRIRLTFSSSDTLQTKLHLTELLKINYSAKNAYVSKACGFKVTYNNLSYNTSGQLVINNFKTEINNNETHLNLQF